MSARTLSGGFAPPEAVRSANPWRALWAMLIGFFMILVDSTIVAVANPSIMEALETDYDAVIWVTSAYLLAYAVPLLVAGRLGDRFGPKNLYLIGLAIFTVASLGCGLAGSVETLIVARVVQGLGAALLTPQTLSTITRIFPPERRGVAMSLWGATAGVATLVGPLAGGVLVDSLGWQWIFFVNVPIGIIGLGLAYWLVPVLPTNRHRFDLLGVALSGVAMFLIVFALQEGQTHDWALWIWAMIAGGLVMMAGFIYWQAINKAEPLIPLSLFRDRNFSLSNVGIAVIGFAVTAMILPLMFYAQAVCGLSPTRSALLTAPMAIASGVLAPLVGRIVDRAHPRPIVGFGFSVLAVSLTWLSIEMTPTTPIWRLVLPFTAMGVGMAFIWAPLAATATRNLPQALAGAGSGVYNATRQVGSVLGSASMAAFMTSQISAKLPGAANQGSQSDVRQLPAGLHEPFASAMSQSMLLPAFVALFGIVAAVFFISGRDTAGAPAALKARAIRAPSVDDYPTDVISAVEDDPDAGYRKTARGDADYSDEYDEYDYDEGDYDDGDYDDDDEYTEYTVDAEHSAPLPMLKPQLAITASPAQQVIPSDDSITEPIPLPAVSAEPEYDDYSEYDDYDDEWQADIADMPHDPPQTPHERPAAADWHIPDPVPVDAWDSFLDNLKDDLRSMGGQPIGHAHNGFHVDDEHDVVQPLDVPEAPGSGGYNGSTNGHVNGSDQRNGSEFLDGLGFATGNGPFLHLNNGVAHLDNGAASPADSEPSSRHAGAEPSSRHYRPEPEPEQWHGYPDAREAGSDSREDDQGVPSYGSHSSAARHHRGDDEDSGFGFGAHRYEPQDSSEPPSGSWRFVDGMWKYETESDTGRHSSGPEDSGRGRHGRD